MLSFRMILAQHPHLPIFSLHPTLLRPVLRIHFQVPHPVSPVFATLTKTAGVCTNNSHSGSSRPAPFLSGSVIDQAFRASRKGSRNSIPCHRSANSPVSPAIATDPKTRLSSVPSHIIVDNVG